jgi:carboxyl-terminal processing protease
MLSAYGDPYTSFSEPAQHELQTNALQGTFGGIGVTLGKDADGFHVLFPFPDSTAAKAGILDGDRLLQVDNVLITPETPSESIQAALRGPVEVPVHLTITRTPEYTEIELIIERMEISLPSVAWHLDPTEPRLGLIQINLIAATTHQEILIAFNDLQTRGAKAYALDLRNNTGGLVNAGIDISRLFLSSGVILEQQYRGQPVETYSTGAPGELSMYPLVVLVNHSTASAAEIIAGSLQANDRAILIGAPTFGKDTIQLVFDLEDGSSLHITAAHWWIPGLNQSMADHGLQPDILVDPGLGIASDPFIDAAIKYFFPD